MGRFHGLEKEPLPNWQGLMDNILRKGTPDRVYHIELFQDEEVKNAIAEKFSLTDNLRSDDTDFELKKYVAVQRFCGFDFVLGRMVDLDWQFKSITTQDTGGVTRTGVRVYQDEHSGPIASWEDFEKYAWPDPTAPSATRLLEWHEKNLPEDMCIIGGLTGHLQEFLIALMGYEPLCYALFDQRDLVKAMAEKLQEFFAAETRVLTQFDRVKMIWGSDDMGFKTGLLLSPRDAREFVLPGHKMLAEISHDAGRPYLLHACGNLSDITDELIDDVKIDAKHSFEDTIEDVREVKHGYGKRVALLGGVDVDFLCRSDEAAIRRRVRETLDICMPGGGYGLGTGNSVANYIPLENYLTMVDEGRLYGT